MDALLLRTVRTAVENAIRLDAMTDDLAAAMSTNGRKSMNGALKAVKDMRSSIHDDFKRFVVVVTTYFTTCHACHSFGSGHVLFTLAGSFKDKGNQQIDLILNDFAIPNIDLLFFHPGAFDVAKGLAGTGNALLDSILKALV